MLYSWHWRRGTWVMLTAISFSDCNTPERSPTTLWKSSKCLKNAPSTKCAKIQLERPFPFGTTNIIFITSEVPFLKVQCQLWAHIPMHPSLPPCTRSFKVQIFPQYWIWCPRTMDAKHNDPSRDRKSLKNEESNVPCTRVDFNSVDVIVAQKIGNSVQVPHICPGIFTYTLDHEPSTLKSDP